MLFLIITMPNSDRPIHMSSYFINDLNQMYGYKALYLDWKKENKTVQENKEDILNLKVPEYYRNITSKIKPYQNYNWKSIDIYRKTYFGLSYFLHETNYRWLHRGSDDNVVNLKNLESFYESIEQKYDPLNEKVILGCCTRHASTPGYLQGGCGFLYSRKAVELMLPIYEDVIFNCKVSEDVCHKQFLIRLNITIINATSLSFLGHPFSKEDSERIDKNDFHDLVPCPKQHIFPENLNQCGVFHGPVNKLVFLHHHADGGVTGIINRTKKVFAVKDEYVHFYFPYFRHPRLCNANMSK
ncbi:hypothetical protein GPJ56_003242 [Histomonas meleagridis]|uniref:uncharacterized protein n=1 Tax=Histomonas meleagridis TaxID=135588 RepID=UPI00355A861A|nr:hypothetical protein GPJ56_003242 [Histomonas meleagridis]KAH0802408.1 hypothetical protein GO595_004786 [Histomonas meleagridis]